jgi:hypothetical protein
MNEVEKVDRLQRNLTLLKDCMCTRAEIVPRALGLERVDERNKVVNGLTSASHVPTFSSSLLVEASQTVEY